MPKKRLKSPNSPTKENKLSQQSKRSPDQEYKISHAEGGWVKIEKISNVTATKILPNDEKTLLQ